MAKIRLLTFNLITQDATIISANSENSLFPLSNLKDSRTTKEFRTQTGTTSAQVVFDFITTEPVTDVAMVGNSLQGFSLDGTVTIEANITNTWGSPGFSTSLAISDFYNFGHTSFAEENYRFWRLSFSNAIDFTGLSNVFIGKNLMEDPFERNINFGWSYENRSNSKFQQNRYKQRFFDKVNNQKIIGATFSNLNKTDYEALQDAFDLNDIFEPLWAVIDPNESFSTDKERFAGQFFINKIPQAKNTSFSRYQLNLSLREAL